MHRRTSRAAELWQAARIEWLDDLAFQHLAESTRERYQRHVNRFAAEIGQDPYSVTSHDFEEWLKSKPVSKRTEYVYRTSIQNFYAWAHRKGRIKVIPTRPKVHPCSRQVSPEWQAALDDFEHFMRAKGTAQTSITTRLNHLRRLARQTGSKPYDLTDEDLTRWLSRQKWARETLRSNRQSIKAFYAWAEHAGHVDSSPAADLPRVRAAGGLPRPATDAQYREALRNADERTTLILRLAAELGLRRAEVATLHTQDLLVDHNGNYWLHVLGKGNKHRPIPVPIDLAALIKQRGPSWVFPGDYEGHISPQYVGVLVTRAMPGATMHQLRHRFATRAFAATHNLLAVQQLLGHVNPTTTQRYVAVAPDQLRDVVNAANQ